MNGHWFKNQGLFSDHFLTERLPEKLEWQTCKELTDFKSSLLKLYEDTKSYLPNLNEAQTEKEFIQPVLDLLGYDGSYIVQTKIKKSAKTNHPDYALFPDQKTKDKAYIKGGIDYSQAVGIADAKYWERPLDITANNERDTFTNINPSFQIINYLTGTQKNWGILTNGRLWRLYSLKAHSHLANYYEVDVVHLLNETSENALKYFYLFFRKKALSQAVDGTNFLDQILTGSIDYAKELEDDIKERAFNVIESLCRGYAASYAAKALNEENLKLIYENSIILLYRLLFLFYAESRELLPLSSNIGYREKYSLFHLAKEIEVVVEKKTPLSSNINLYYQQLKSLSKLINEGDDSLGVPKYNGGLFSPIEHPFIEQHTIADFYLADAIYRLAMVTDRHVGIDVAVDYKTLSERHLGNIYEGLLEFTPHIAESDLVIIKEKGGEKFEPASDHPAKDVKYKKGQLYLANDKGQRKATGSYYTPEYIVSYIVENTIAPLLNDASQKVKSLKPAINKKIRALQKTKEENKDKEPTEKYDKAIAVEREKLIEPYLSFKILDPAMGSGHFLARATDYIAEAIAKDHNVVAPEGLSEESEHIYYRRRVVESCIYGVDLNPLAVELAKLTLWLSTMAKFKPLSFLNHHLRVGNSLIGADITELDEIPKRKKKKTSLADLSRAPVQIGQYEWNFAPKITLLLKNRALIAQIPTETLEDIRKKEEWEKSFQNDVSRFRLLADISSSFNFNNNLAWDTYNNLVENLQSPETTWNKLIQNRRVDKAKYLKDKKHFFHWELEFPEVFYDDDCKKKENPGFDVVLGNPPYGSKEILDLEEKTFFDKVLHFTDSGDVAAMFIEKSFGLLRKQGFFGFIVPKPLSYITSWSDIRNFINGHTILTIGDVSQAFTDVLLEQIIIICNNSNPSNTNSVSITGVENKNLILRGNVPQSSFKKRIFPLYRYGANLQIAEKLESVSLPLSNYLRVWAGVGGITSKLSKEKIGQLILKGESVSRYAFTDDIWYVSPDAISENDIKEHAKARVVAQDIVAHVTQPTDHIIIMASWAQENALTQETVINFSQIKEDSLYSLYFFLALINSKLNSWYVYRYIFNKAIRTMHYRPGYADYSLICDIKFNTLQDERTNLLETGKNFYNQYLVSKDSDQMLEFVIKQLPSKSSAGANEHSDVIHDVLAYLAQEMVRLNKENQIEVNRFLHWLEEEIIKKPIEEQKNKTKIKEFYEDKFVDLLNVLKKNKTIPNPYPSKDRTTLENEFIGSFNLIKPLREKIKLTDELIDQIVYRLYVLTDEEIKTIESS